MTYRRQSLQVRPAYHLCDPVHDRTPVYPDLKLVHLHLVIDSLTSNHTLILRLLSTSDSKSTNANGLVLRVVFDGVGDDQAVIDAAICLV